MLGPIKSAKPVNIKVLGVKGEFYTGHGDKAEEYYSVQYFTTVVSSSAAGGAGNSADLLHQLKPMRERTSAGSLADLNSLLQRDLNDQRIAGELIPYLLGKNSEIAFFPGALIALMPKDFLSRSASRELDYPEEQKTESGSRFDGFWEVELAKDENGMPTSLGTLSINPMETDLIVLDGQHRVNAFRYLSGYFDEATSDSIYAPFYEGLSVPEQYRSELPITIVWFRAPAKKKVEPILISRKLFVDVNTNARPVSRARNILLDDSSIETIATGALYQTMAEHGFDCNVLSLLHSAFDSEEFYEPEISVISPTICEYGLKWLLLGKDSYVEPGRNIERDPVRSQSNYESARGLLQTDVLALVLKVDEGDHEAVFELRNALKSHVAKDVYDLYNHWSFLEGHYRATGDVAGWASQEPTPAPTVWTKIFSGGEGLYLSYRRLEGTDGLNDKSKRYLREIHRIQDKFLSFRADRYGWPVKVTNEVFSIIKTKAFFAGFLMAYAYLIKNSASITSAKKKFLKAINAIPVEFWRSAFSESRMQAIGKLEPKRWTHIRDILLRAIEQYSDIPVFRGRDIRKSPDFDILKRTIENRIKVYCDKEGVKKVEPTPSLISEWSKESSTQTGRLLEQLGLDRLREDGKLAELAVDVINSAPRVITPKHNEDEEEDDGVS